MSVMSVPRYDEEGATEILVREEDAESVLQIDLPDSLPRLLQRRGAPGRELRVVNGRCARRTGHGAIG